MGGAICVHPDDHATLRLAAPSTDPYSFSFDHVAGEHASQEDIFNIAGRHIVENCLQGYNGCLFAYGQTGSGKTHTMIGNDTNTYAQRGLIQRIFEQIFASESSTSMKITCSFLEIYNETISDLLSPALASQPQTHLPMRDDGRRVFVEGLTSEAVLSVDDVTMLLERGTANRRVGETLMNERSSRSHSVFTATVEIRRSETDAILRSCLHLVDLAGSERQKTTGAAGERLKEASSINKSLSALGLVIKTLVDQQQGKQCHVPYRDSKLTTWLRDSLGGNAKTVMVACVSPASLNASETLSTLRFADGAKRIKNKAVVNEDVEGDVESLKMQVKKLKEQLLAANGNNSATATIQSPMEIPTASKTTTTNRRALVAALRREDAAARRITALQQELDEMKDLNEKRNKELRRMEMMLKLKEGRISKLTVVNNGDPGDASDLVASLQQEIELLQSKLDSHPEVKRFAVENLHLSHQVERLSRAIDEEELVILHADIAGLRGEILELVQAKEVSEEDAERARAEAEAAREALHHHVAVAREAKAKLQEQGVEMLDQLERENDELLLTAAEVVPLREETARLCAHAAGLETERDGLKKELDGLKSERDGLKKEYGTLEEEHDRLKIERDDLKTRLDGLKMGHNALEKECDGLKMERDDLKTVHDALETELNDLKTVHDALEREHAGLQTAHGKRSIELQDAKEQHEKQKEALKAAESANEQTEVALSEAIKVQQEQHTEMAGLQSRVEALDTEVASLQATLNTVTEERDRLVTHVGAQKKELAMLEVHAADTTTALKSHKESLARAQSELASLKNELEHTQESLAQLQQDKDELAYELSDKSASLRETAEQLTVMRSNLRTTTAEKDTIVAMLTAQLREANAGERAAKDEVAGLSKKLLLLQEELKEMETEVQAARCGPMEIEQQLILSRKELNAARMELTRAQRDKATMEAAMRRKDDDLARMRGEMAAEVNCAANQVQELLAAQARAEVAEERAAELAKRIRSPSVGP